jgi:dihydrofolate reductase
MLKNYNTDDVYIIGGASVYRQMLPYCDTAIVTKFDKSFEKDVFIPNLDELEDWKLVNISDTMYSDPATDTEGNLPFNFCTYKKTV